MNKAIHPFLTLLIFATGCIATHENEKSLASLQHKVAQEITRDWQCGPILKQQWSSGYFFELTRTNSYCKIWVGDREFLTQREWARRNEIGTNLLEEYVALSKTNGIMDPHRFERMNRMLSLPNWSYHNIGVDVDVICPEVTYPALEKQSSDAQLLVDKITGLLTKYKKP
jgi:hypothetical protein